MSKINLKTLRNSFKHHNIEGFIVPSNDEFLSEYVPPSLNRLKFLTGFTGSNGVAIVTNNNAVFYTDGRYLLQAAEELSTDYTILDMYKKESCDWFDIGIKPKQVLGYDPMLHSKKNLEYYQKLAKKYRFSLKAVPNLIDEIWQDKKYEFSKAFIFEEKHAGKSYKKKIKEVCALINADYLFIPNPDAVCWLLNIRAFDVPYVPVLLSYALVSKKGKVYLFCNPKSFDLNLPNVEVVNIADIKEFFINLSNRHSIQIDESKTPVWFCVNAKNVVLESDPIEILKACKNDIEIKGIKNAHIKDGIALSKFFKWLSKNWKGLDEALAAKKLLEFRKEQKGFVEPSFSTISAYGPNGAIVHYKPPEKKSVRIQDDNLYLLDSGGHYYEGTTDVTRTIHLGKPTQAHKKDVTNVLKGHIAIATAKFPIGTSGAQLDVLARIALWKDGKNYDHGTGHGVGHFLSVHEGPHGISKGRNTELKAGMIVSNEPGFYKTGKYGIRIESILLVVPSKDQGFLEFETLTYVPIQEELVEVSLLTIEEKKWLKQYNELCEQILK